MRALVITNTITKRDSLSLEKYLNEVAKYDVLSPDEELRLFQQYHEGDDRAFQKLIKSNLRFVISVAKQYQHCGLGLNDLINEGNIGLIKAIERFDETKGFKFISYAVWWIRQSILLAIGEKSKEIRTPLNQQSVSLKVYQTIEELQQQLERSPSATEIAEKLDMKPEVVSEILSKSDTCQSLDAPFGEEEEGSLMYVVQDQSIPQPDTNMAVTESQAQEIAGLLNSLEPREAQVISLYFGLGTSHASTLNDISEDLGLSRERVRQIKGRALKKLRKMMASKNGEDFSMN
ncbi:MAG: RNA polymerase sigma factor RpoD/SigA [Saprospiraceae bacterium]|jgi:RNA polymerase primary sigma factor|nr:RNA polymerase sigma factor RpoD/SigA [Saprospiraceae bacterium]MDP4821276.1 RNA polymerase sigma factor RpoD/SigA [Saprospiraceae bacterium]MDP4998141.1 RNA polymerase sigma factor RpoD/SigA [Saprospiraceae bacterium]